MPGKVIILVQMCLTFDSKNNNVLTEAKEMQLLKKDGFLDFQMTKCLKILLLDFGILIFSKWW